MSARHGPYWDSLHALADQLSSTFGPRFAASGMKLRVVPERVIGIIPSKISEELYLEVTIAERLHEHGHLALSSRRWFSDKWTPIRTVDQVRGAAERILQRWSSGGEADDLERPLLNFAQRGFGAWSGTREELIGTLTQLKDLFVGPRLECRVDIEGGEPLRQAGLDDLRSLPAETTIRSLAFLARESNGERMEVVFSHKETVPSTTFLDHRDYLDEVPVAEIVGQTVTVFAATPEKAEEIADAALGLLRSGLPWWGRARLRGAWHIRRPESLVALSLLAGAFAGNFLFWPLPGAAFFFGALTGLVFVLAGVKIDDWLMPRFEVHSGRSRWDRYGRLVMSSLVILPAVAGLALRIAFPVAG